MRYLEGLRYLGGGRGMGWLLFLVSASLTLLASATGAAPAAERSEAVVVRAMAEPDRVTIGDPIRYTIEITAAEDAELIVPVLGGALGAFTITDFGELPQRREDAQTVVSRWYTLTVFEPGEHFLPAPRVGYRLPGQEVQEVEGNEVRITVRSLLAEEPQADDIREIKGPEAPPFDWRPYAAFAGALIVGAGVLAAFIYFVNRPRQRPMKADRPAHEHALAALARLRARHLVEDGRFDEYYVGLSGIVRQYMEGGFAMRAPEMTTEEFLTALSVDVRLAATQRRLLGDFLVQADLVKFARHRPSAEDAEGAYVAAQRLIEETRPRDNAEHGGEGRRAAA